MTGTQEQKNRVVVVTGLSGAGKSTALAALEDLGYYCVDNLPAPVLVATLEALEKGGYHRMAVGLDVRGHAYLDGSAELIDRVATSGQYQLDVLFLEAPDELLARRFSATRRPHPLSNIEKSGVRAVMDAIDLERKLLSELRARASIKVDTAKMTVHDLRHHVVKLFAGGEGAQKMRVRIVSFGFKYGTPADADMVLDVRFLPNPFFVEDLRPLSGKDELVARFVRENPDAVAFLERCLPLLEFCLPKFEREGKSYVSIAIGCTGGRHRSVTLAEVIAGALSERLGIDAETSHRDILQAEHRNLAAASGSDSMG